MNLSELFDFALGQKASDIHLATGEPPRLRVGGELIALTENVGVEEALTAEERSRLAIGLTVERTIVHGETLFVGIAFRTAIDGLALTFRLLPKSVPSFERIMEGARDFFEGLAQRRKGLVVVAGPMGSGKTTTALALIDRINAERPARIFVISDGASHVFENRRALVSHLRIGQECETYARAMRIASQASADVLTTDDLPTHEDLRQALLLVDEGALVVANLNAADPAQAVERLLESARDEAPALRRALAENLVAVTAQRLLPAVGGGKVPVYEWIVGGPSVREALLSGGDLPAVQAEDAACRTLGYSVRELYRRGRITLHDAMSLSPEAGNLTVEDREMQR